MAGALRGSAGASSVPGTMNAVAPPDPRLQRVLSTLWSGLDARSTPLPGGITNHNYLVEVDGERFVARLAGRGTELLGIDRYAEHAAAEAVGSRETSTPRTRGRSISTQRGDPLNSRSPVVDKGERCPCLVRCATAPPAAPAALGSCRGAFVEPWCW
jgi:hypothetical protein